MVKNEELLEDKSKGQHHDHHHPDAFQVSGPRNFSSPNWRDLINSTWKDANHKRTAMACFIQAVYLLELDRQENRTGGNALAAKWWTPFKYKMAEALTDDRDGSIFGAVLEWDRAAAVSDLVLIRPSGAPRAVLALRGTLLNKPTIRRDIEDDLRFLAWESLKGSVRFSTALKALRAIAIKYGSSNVCVAGHSLGAGFALQVGKAVAKEGMFVEAHLFNPPSVSLATSVRNLSDKAGFAWKRLRSMLPASPVGNDDAAIAKSKQFVPHLYINDNDYLCCWYTDNGDSDAKATSGANVATAARMFVTPKGNQRFLEAHRLEQWWSDDLELRAVVQSSKLISMQLKSLYCVAPLPTTQQKQGKVV